MNSHTNQDTCIVDINNVSLFYKGDRVLRDVSYKIYDLVRPGETTGQITGLLGPSGVGKTQLSRLVAGLTDKDDPDIKVTGEINILREGKMCPASRGYVGVVDQYYRLFVHRTVMSNLMVAARKGGIPKDQRRERVREYLNKFNLLRWADHYPKQLSGGQKQRVAIIQQLLCSNLTIFFDEPFSGQDPNNVYLAQKLIRETANQSELNTLMITTHDIASAVATCDTLVLMGFERDKDNKPIPGATIIDVIDLIDRGLAWQPHVHRLPAFKETEDEIRHLFRRKLPWVPLED